MNALVQDFTTHPLLPGSLLAVLCGEPAVRAQNPLDYPTLVTFNKQTTVEIVGYFQNNGLISESQASKVIQVDGEFSQGWANLKKHLPEVAEVISADRAAVERLARVLFGARLLGEYLEIFTHPELSYEKTAAGTVDLLDSLANAFRQIIGGAWSVYYPRGEVTLLADASANFWVAGLHHVRPAEMAEGFVAFFRRDHADRLRMLNHDHKPERVLRLKDAIAEYVDSSKEKLTKLHEVVERPVREGLDRSFAEIARVTGKLELPPLVLQFYEHLIREACEAFAAMDGGVSSRENRFTQFLLKQIAVICQEQPVLGSGGTGATPERIEQVLQELGDLVGIVSVKEKVRQTAHFALVQQHRLKEGLRPIPTSYHSVYVGNPGTGKTTVARLMGRIYKSLGILKKGHLVECDRSALVAEYVGQTAVRTNAVIDSALDGILFIDEAYSLARDNEDYGHEALETLIKRMEDNRDRLIVIVAGYPIEMERFISSNPGLHSRFSRRIEFPDYSALELCRIFGRMCRQNMLLLTPALREKVVHHFQYLWNERSENFGNARLVRNCFETVIVAQATRLALSGQLSPESLSRLEAVDLATPAEAALQEYQRSGKTYALFCQHCGAAYRWIPENDLREAQCSSCGLVYDGEFGQVT